MTFPEAKPHRSLLLRLGLLLGAFSLLLWACNISGENKVEHTLSFSKHYDSLSQFEKVVIVVEDSAGAWSDTVFSGKVDSRAKIENLKSPHYHGTKVDIIIIGYNGGKVAYEVEKRYDGATGKTDSTALVITASTTVVSEAASLEVKEDGSLELPRITVTPSNLADKTLAWASSDTSVFTVTGNRILGRKPGPATLKVNLISDPSKGTDIAVTVIAKLPPVDTLKPPAAPIIASLIAGDTKITLTWNSVVGAESYNIFYGEGASVDRASTRIKGITSPFEVGGLRNGALYAFALTSVNAAGESNLGAAQTATPQIPAASAPAITSVMAGIGKVTLNWEPVSGATGYTLYYKIGSTVDKSGGTKVASVTSPHELTGLSANTQYAFAVTSQTAAGESGLSNITSAKTFPAAPVDLVYAVNPVVYFAGVAVIENTVTVTGVVDSFMVTPALPPGLTLNKTTGAVSGTPTAASTAWGYEVTALNLAGSAKAILNIAVQGAPTGLVYSQNPASYWKGVAITANTAAIAGAVDSFTVSPALPAGLSLSKTTGAITGTPTEASTATAYTMTAHGKAGNSTAPLSITVSGPPSGLTYTHNPATYYQTVAITTNIASVSGLVDSFTVSPALPAGLTLGKSTGSITGTPTVAATSSVYTVTARNPAGAATAQLTLTVNGAPAGLAYSVNPAAYWKGVAIATNAASISGSVDSFTVSPALPVGLALNKTTGAVTGTPTVAATAAFYTVTAYSKAGNTTGSLSIGVNGPPTVLSYAENPATYWQTVVITANAATVSGIVDSFTVSPALPAGLSLNKATGSLTGTPSAPAASASYTISAWNPAGSTTAQVTLLVNGPPSGLTYATNPAIYWNGVAITANIATVSGSVDSFTINPALPAGLALNKTSGAITGTPTAAAASALYTITARNKAGYATAGITLVVNGPPSNLTYSANPAVYTRNIAISQNTATVTGVVDSFTVSPALPVGLALTKASGAVTGTPTLAISAATYTVTAWNKAGTTTVGLSIRVNYPSGATILYTTKDYGLDTTSGYNVGRTPIAGFSSYPANKYFALFQWDLSTLSTVGLTSAKAVFRTYGYGPDWNGTPVTMKARVFRINSNWVEGTGNWYYHNGAFANGGATLLANYDFNDSLKAACTDPAVNSGMTGYGDRALFREANMTAAGTTDIVLNYTGGAWVPSWPTSFPAPNSMVEIEIDLTTYVMAAAGGTDYGITIELEGATDSKTVHFLTKEINDGTLGPRLEIMY